MRRWRPHAACWRSRWLSWSPWTMSCWRRNGSGRLGEVPWKMKKAKLRDAQETCRDCWTMRSRTGDIQTLTQIQYGTDSLVVVLISAAMISCFSQTACRPAQLWVSPGGGTGSQRAQGWDPGPTTGLEGAETEGWKSVRYCESQVHVLAFFSPPNKVCSNYEIISITNQSELSWQFILATVLVFGLCQDILFYNSWVWANILDNKRCYMTAIRQTKQVYLSAGY